MDEPSTRRIRYPNRSSPATCNGASKSDGSETVTSRNSTGSDAGRWWLARSSASFSRYSVSSRSSGSLAMTWISRAPVRSARKPSATGSTWMAVTRSSVTRSTRDSSDVVMIAAMNRAAIFTPSGRSMTLAMVV